MRKVVRQSVQRQLIIWTSVLVVALGVAVVLTCLQPPSSEETLFTSGAYARKHRRTRTIASPNATAPTANDSPAPRTVGLAIADGSLAQAIEVKLDCSGSQKGVYQGSVNQVRFSGKICAPDAAFSSSEIRNEANGTSATVFFPTSVTFTTDYITLAPGPNRIRILNLLKNGSKEEREYVIERAPASQSDQKM